MIEISSKRKLRILMWAAIAAVGVAGVIFFLAQYFSVKKYTVRFDTGGGDKIADVIVKENETVQKPADPGKVGYLFAGWYYNGEEFDFNTKITKDITLIAHWDSAIGLKSKSMSIFLNSDDNYKLEFKYLPKGVSLEDLVYSSSDEETLTVDEEGNLTPLKVGKVVVTIKSKDGKYETTCEITITEKEIEVEDITIKGYTTVPVGETITLVLEFNPSNATNKNVTWSSSDTSIAVVNAYGVVTGIREGTVTITVETENGKTASYIVSVYVYSPAVTPTPDPTPEPAPSEPVYTINIKARDLGGGALTSGSVQYDYTVTKDGIALSSNDFIGIEFSSTDRIPSSQSSISSTMAEKGYTTAKLTLSDETVVTATVVVTK